DKLGPGREHQVKRVAQDHLVAERGDLARLERLHGALGRQRHERGGANVAVGQVKRARAGTRTWVSGPDREHVRTDPTWLPSGPAGTRIARRPNEDQEGS